jgi:hypothetical protein
VHKPLIFDTKPDLTVTALLVLAHLFHCVVRGSSRQQKWGNSLGQISTPIVKIGEWLGQQTG